MVRLLSRPGPLLERVQRVGRLMHRRPFELAIVGLAVCGLVALSAPSLRALSAVPGAGLGAEIQTVRYHEAVELETAESPACAFGDVTLVSARGSGEWADLDGDGRVHDSDVDKAGRYGAAVFRELSDRFDGSGVEVGLVPVDYEAVSVEDVIGSVFRPDRYVSSVNGGVALTVGLLREIADAQGCGVDHPVVLVGYSQGAQVMQLVLEESGGTRLAGMPAGVGLFADPMFTWDDPSARGSFPRDATGVASFFAPWFGAARVPSEFAAMTRSWCLWGDAVCDATVDNATSSVHTGNGYGVSQDGYATVPGTAVGDVVNTIEWALRTRGVFDDVAIAGRAIGEPTVTERSRGDSGSEYSSIVWISAAEVVGTVQPVSGYQWDLDGDGSFEVSGDEPSTIASLDRTDRGGAADTRATVGVRVAGPAGLTAEFDVCWDVKTHAYCPTPSSDSFSDDDGSVFEADIEWLVAEGITRGCNPPVSDRFCPESVVTRGQMAAFLTRALGLTERLSAPFVDDDASIFESDIERLAAAGITRGCNPPKNDRFCPNGKVTREQMAAFLVRAMGYIDDGGGDLYTDDDDSVFEGDIDRLGTAGVTRGCNPPQNDRFCPKANVTRGQMAAFLHRALA